MKIAINARFTGLDYFVGHERFTQSLIKTWSTVFPDDELILLLDRPPVESPSIPYAIKGPAFNHPVLWNLWYSHRLPAMAKDINADILFSPYGMASLNAKTTQVLTLHHLSYLTYADGLSSAARRYLHWNTGDMIRKSDHILTSSMFSKSEIIQHFPKAKGKITVVPKAADPGFKPMNWEEKEKVKEQYSKGFDYFLYVGAIHSRQNILHLLKGFSWFKKRHKSGIKLVLAGKVWDPASFSELMSNYKYKEEVLLLGQCPQKDIIKLMAGAYAFVYPAFFDGFGLPVLEAMQAGTPVICSNTGAIPELTGEAGVYCNPNDAEAFGKAMGLLYKDEDHRAKQIQAGLERSRSFSWENSTQQVRAVFTRISETKH